MLIIQSFLDKLKGLYNKYDRPLSSFALILGFVIDTLTLKRVDSIWENVWVITHLVVVAVVILILNFDEEKLNRGEGVERGHFWLVNILQFVFGGLLSALLVFYFRSSTLSATWPFIFVLVLAFWASDRLKKHYAMLVFQTSLFFLALFCFSIFSVPIVLHKIGPIVFVISGLVSLGIMFLFLIILRRVTRIGFDKEKKSLFAVIFGIFSIFNILYFTNLIPPLPLSLKDAGVYHSISKDMRGDYVVSLENYGWQGFFNIYDDFHVVDSNESVYVYSSIFSPSLLDLGIVHRWQHYDETTNDWISVSQIYLPVIGGRGEGFRTYSLGSGLEAGKWRVNVETENGATIGRISFNLVQSNIAPKLYIKIK